MRERGLGLRAGRGRAGEAAGRAGSERACAAGPGGAERPKCRRAAPADERGTRQPPHREGMGAVSPCGRPERGGWDRGEEAKPAGVGRKGPVFLLAAGGSGSGLPVGALREIGQVLRVFQVRGQSEIDFYLSPYLSGV